MLEIKNDSSIHLDGIYEIDKRCTKKTFSLSNDENSLLFFLAFILIFSNF